MTNIARATFVINETYADEYVKPHMTPLKVAQDLADAGLLMPDLPEADSDGRLWPEHDFNYEHVQSPKFTGTGNIIIARGASSLALTREEALELASLLTAAATEEA